MPSWTDVTLAAPDLAAVVQRRFEAHGLALLATIRRDGSPRISGIEPLFSLGELWLGMMPGSRKADDLLRDPRFALHSATTDKQVTEGDAKVNGRAALVDDDEVFARFVQAFDDHNGAPPPPGPFPLFRAEVTEMSTVMPAGDHLDIGVWREGREATTIARY